MISLTNLLIMDENVVQINYGVWFLTSIFSVFSTSHINLHVLFKVNYFYYLYLCIVISVFI